MDVNLMELSSQEVGQKLKAGEVTIAVVGVGRIGLPTAVSFAEAGANVIGIDVDPKVVSELKAGTSRFVDEPGVNDLLRKLVRSHKFSVSTEVERVSEADVVVISVPTPVDERKVPNYSYIRGACESISKHLKKGSIVLIESTVGPGAVEEIVIPLLEKGSEMKVARDFGVASCPERANPGNILRDMKNVPRIVGGIDARSSEVAATLYETAFSIKAVKVSTPKTANAAKLTENIFRDVNIALSNEFAMLFEKLGIDAIEVIAACSTKYNFVPHYPGSGVGGPCLPSNSYYLISEGLKVGNIPYIIRMAREINDRMPDHIVTLIADAMNEINKTIRGSKISVLGVSYKPNIKDLQLTPVETISLRLKEMGARISIYDPYYEGEDVFGIKVEKDLQSATIDADCVFIGTAHDQFKAIDLDMLARLTEKPAAIVDANRVINPDTAREIGFVYKGVGRV